MIGINLIARFNHSLRNLTTHTKLSVGTRGLRTKFKKKRKVFTEDIMFFKEPFGQFKTWYDEACNTPSIIEPRAMCLATCTRSGIPSARFVILRGYSADGFKFFTNYCSRKGEELKENPNATLVFYWESLKRSQCIPESNPCSLLGWKPVGSQTSTARSGLGQMKKYLKKKDKKNIISEIINKIRIEGTAKKLSDEESTLFFHSRPKSYQIEAAFSDQSQPISSRVSLIEKEKKFKDQFENCDFIPKPKEWGGFILKPHAVEFWQGQNDRLHDRIRFRIPKENEVINNILLHQGENGWVYERLQP